MLFSLSSDHVTSRGSVNGRAYTRQIRSVHLRVASDPRQQGGTRFCAGPSDGCGQRAPACQRPAILRCILDHLGCPDASLETESIALIPVGADSTLMSFSSHGYLYTGAPGIATGTLVEAAFSGALASAS